jgi:hypothetical protein
MTLPPEVREAVAWVRNSLENPDNTGSLQTEGLCVLTGRGELVTILDHIDRAETIAPVQPEAGKFEVCGRCGGLVNGPCHAPVQPEAKGSMDACGQCGVRRVRGEFLCWGCGRCQRCGHCVSCRAEARP